MAAKALILAAGKGTRMRSNTPKVIFDVAGKPMINYIVNTAEKVCSDKSVLVVGNESGEIRQNLVNCNVDFAVQDKQKGTADAVMAAKDFIENYKGKILVLCGDMPLITAETLKDFVANSSAPVNFISVKVKSPKGYGRVVRGADGCVLKITEEKDADDHEKKINEINTGIYLVDSGELLRRLRNVNDNNAQKEYYLTDIIKEGAEVYQAEDEEEFLGINDRAALARAARLMWLRRAEAFMQRGVSIIDPYNFYCDEDVEIMQDAEIYPNVTLKGKTSIGSNTEIHQGCKISDSNIENDCIIKDNCFINESVVGEHSSIGPMAHLRPGSKLHGYNKIGNFVEVKKSEIYENAQASHLSYIGDAYVGKNVNIGCGTITCNYDGIKKHRTVINDNVFVGSDVQFVAPVEIGQGSLIAAGSTITKDVPEESLGISRSDQINKEGWVKKRKKFFGGEE